MDMNNHAPIGRRSLRRSSFDKLLRANDGMRETEDLPFVLSPPRSLGRSSSQHESLRTRLLGFVPFMLSPGIVSVCL